MIKEVTFTSTVPTVINKLLHEDYPRVTELSEQYKALITGVGLEPYIKQFNLRETEEMFKQRLVFTQVTTQPICKKIRAPLQKIAGVKPIVKSVKIDDKDDKAESSILSAIKKFYGEKDVDGFLKERLLGDIIDTDPNAFVIITFDDFNSRIEKPTVYATVVSSTDAVNFSYVNNELEWLIVRREIEYETARKDKDGNNRTAVGDLYIAYGDEYQIEYTQIDIELMKAANLTPQVLIHPETFIETDPVDAVPNVEYLFRVDKKRLFTVEFHQTKAPFVPAFRAGCIYDELTNGRTVVSIIHPAIPYLLKGINTGSEHDVSIALHAFPQKVTYAPKCKGTPDDPCFDGRTGVNGIGECRVCNGTGHIIHKSGQDTIILTLPKRPDDIIDLNRLVAYIEVPMDIVKWLDEYVDKLETKCLSAVYNSDRFTTQTVAETATKNLIDMQSVNDALQPIAEHYSESWKLIVTLIAYFNTSTAKVEVQHKFPRNFRFESVDELLNQLKVARESGASPHIIEQINTDLASLLYIDNPDALTRINTMQLFDPFAGRTDDMITMLINGGFVTRHNIVLYTFLKQIFDKLEQESKQAEINFYELSYEKQKEKIGVEVDIIISQLDKEKPKLDVPPIE